MRFQFVRPQRCPCCGPLCTRAGRLCTYESTAEELLGQLTKPSGHMSSHLGAATCTGQGATTGWNRRGIPHLTSHTIPHLTSPSIPHLTLHPSPVRRTPPLQSSDRCNLSLMGRSPSIHQCLVVPTCRTSVRWPTHPGPGKGKNKNGTSWPCRGETRPIHRLSRCLSIPWSPKILLHPPKLFSYLV